MSFLWDAVCSQRFGILKGDSYRKTETPNSFTSVTLPYKQIRHFAVGCNICGINCQKTSQ